jgi:hypothetical protein
MNKYNAKKTRVGDLVFDSQKEARRWSELVLLERAGVIRRLERGEDMPVVIGGVKVFSYRPDFVYFEDGARIVEDVKGFRTPVYRLKKRILAALYGIEIRET